MPAAGAAGMNHASSRIIPGHWGCCHSSAETACGSCALLAALSSSTQAKLACKCLHVKDLDGNHVPCKW